MNTLIAPNTREMSNDRNNEAEMEPIIPHLWGPINRQGVLPAQEVALMTTTLFEMDEVRVYAFADADIDLYVYDRFGVMVAYDTTVGGMPSCNLLPVGTGEYLIKVVNNAPHSVEFVLHTA